jgi:uncharacterized protein YdaU (DUF1376 family)
MSNDPAFLFYTGDFTTGTQFFTDEQVGIYIRLLMAQHQHGHLSDKQVKMICRTHDEDVMLKFEKDSDGKFFNKRLEDEIFKRKKYSLSRSENKKGKTKDMLIISKSYDNHMENENENENKDINKDKSKIKNLNGISYEISKLSLVMQSEDSVGWNQSQENTNVLLHLQQTRYLTSSFTLKHRVRKPRHCRKPRAITTTGFAYRKT